MSRTRRTDETFLLLSVHMGHVSPDGSQVTPTYDPREDLSAEFAALIERGLIARPGVAGRAYQLTEAGHRAIAHIVGGGA